MNRLFFGDNLGWLRNKERLPDAGVDLVCLDPPFNSDEEADERISFHSRRARSRFAGTLTP